MLFHLAYFLFLRFLNRHGSVCIEGEVRDVAGLKFVIALRADHCGIVAAEGQRRHIKLEATLFAGKRQPFAQQGICRYAARRHQYGAVCVLRGAQKIVCKAIDDRFTEGGGKVGYRQRLILL